MILQIGSHYVTDDKLFRIMVIHDYLFQGHGLSSNEYTPPLLWNEHGRVLFPMSLLTVSQIYHKVIYFITARNSHVAHSSWNEVKYPYETYIVLLKRTHLSKIQIWKIWGDLSWEYYSTDSLSGVSDWAYGHWRDSSGIDFKVHHHRCRRVGNLKLFLCLQLTILNCSELEILPKMMNKWEL